MRTSPVDDFETCTSGASGSSTSSNACSKSSDDLLSESATSDDQLPHKDLLTASMLDQTPESDINVSRESSISTPKSHVSVSDVDDHIHTSGSDRDIINSLWMP